MTTSHLIMKLWPYWSAIFFATLASHVVFYLYLSFFRLCVSKWKSRHNRVTSIRLIPGKPSENRML